MKSGILSCALALGAGSGAMAVDVLVLSSKVQEIDAAVVDVLEAGGHGVTVGPYHGDLTDGTDLSGYDVVYLQPNAWYGTDIPQSGQESLVEFIEAGGGLVTCEWTVWETASFRFQIIKPAMPTVYKSFHGELSATYTKAAHDAVLSAGVPDSFTMTLTSHAGTETILARPCGATEYYSSTYGAGVLGWNYGIGRVLSFSTVNGVDQLADENFARLFSNAMEWASLGGGPPPDPAYADCDDSRLLDFFDFLCFSNSFNAQEDYADCDGDGVLNLFDFLCFVNAFNAGC